MKKSTMLVGILAGFLLASAPAVQGQSALEIVRKLEALEARLGGLEGEVAMATPSQSASEDSSDLEGGLAEVRAEIRKLAEDLAALRADTGASGEIQAQFDGLAAELAALRASVDREPVETEEPVEGVAEALAEVRAYMEAAAEREAESEDSPIKFTGRVQTQYSTTSAPDEIGSEFVIRRARLTAELRINEIVSGKIQPDFGSGKISLKDAYVAFDFTPAFGVTVGQFKRPFDLFELTSSTKILTIERAGIVRGAGSCAGPGGICSYSRFTEKLGYADRDIGARFDGRGGDWAWQASITNGAGANNAEETTSKSYGARLVYGGLSNVSIGANVALHDYENDIDSSRTYGNAYGLDVEWGSFSSGWHLQAAGIQGDNWKNLDVSGTPSEFRAVQGILTYKVPLAAQGLDALEPLFRVSWADPNAGFDEDHEIFVTGGLVAHFVGRNKIALNLERWIPSIGEGQWSVKIQSYLHF